MDNSRANLLLEQVNLKVKTVASLIKAGELRVHGDIITADNGVALRTIYGENSTITICRFKSFGGRVSDHIHKNVSEYLICVKGQFNVQFKGGYRILLPAQCVSIPPNWLHSVTALEEESELIAVCVPEEISFLPEKPEFRDSISGKQQ